MPRKHNPTLVKDRPPTLPREPFRSTTHDQWLVEGSSNAAELEADRKRCDMYEASMADDAYRLCLVVGATVEDLAAWFRVDERAIRAWRKKYKRFDDAIKAGSVMADSRVAESLYRRATGYSHPAVKIVADPNTGKDVQVEYTQMYPPDTTACIFWLKNRQRQHWRDRWELEHSGKIDITARKVEQERLSKMTEDELLDLQRTLLSSPPTLQATRRKPDDQGTDDDDGGGDGVASKQVPAGDR